MLKDSSMVALCSFSAYEKTTDSCSQSTDLKQVLKPQLMAVNVVLYVEFFII
jgi:hypothetical protein